MSHDHSHPSYKRKNRKLYKNPDKAKVCGVCAGLSEYFDFETWVVRLISVSFFLFSGGTAVVAYFVACFIMETKPGSKSNKGCFGIKNKAKKKSNDSQYQASVKDVWRKGSAPTELLHKAEEKFTNMERKLQAMETYITSDQYQLEKEFEKIV
jgi:phage shock protein C